MTDFLNLEVCLRWKKRKESWKISWKPLPPGFLKFKVDEAEESRCWWALRVFCGMIWGGAQAKKRIDGPALLVVLLCNFACGFFWVYFWHSILIFLLCVCNFFFFF